MLMSVKLGTSFLKHQRSYSSRISFHIAYHLKEHQKGFKMKVTLKVTGYSLLINYSWAILIHYFAKSECWMEPSTMVLCKMDKYYNQLKF